MADPDSLPPLYLTVLLVASVLLLWQILRALRPHPASALLPRVVFWLGLLSWLVLGLWLRVADAPPWPAKLDWIVPVGGLLLGAIARRIATTRLPIEQDETARGVASPAESGNGAEELDAEDVRLLHRLIGLLARRAAHLMVPVTDIPTVDQTTTLAQILDLLRADGGLRIPVLDHGSGRPVGIIVGRDLLPRIYPSADAAPADETVTAATLCRPIPAVPERATAKDALDKLRGDNTGVAAVVNPRGQVVGFLAWQPIFRMLLGRQARGGAL